MSSSVQASDHRPAMKLGRVTLWLIALRNRLTPAVARRRHTRPVRFARLCASQLLDMFANVNFDLEHNGELRVLEQLRRVEPSVVFDVGANVGDWSMTAARVLHNTRIHAFEIVPQTASDLRSRIEQAHADSVVVNAIGLSDHAGEIPVAYLPAFSEGSSAAVVQPADEVQWVDCPVQTGDAYCAEHGIERIDLLKIDVEGLESRVLAGFESMLSRGAVRAVQFEYGHLNASVRFLLGDFYDLFGRHGYAVGKIYPDGVEFHEYDAWRDEDFKGPNYLAVRGEDATLIALLAAPV
jgi:FkbM family methyltransferase